MSGFFFTFAADRLRVIREQQGRSREQLAIDAGLSYPMIALLEHGDRNPSRAALLRLAAALGVHPSELVDRDPDFEAVAP